MTKTELSYKEAREIVDRLSGRRKLKSRERKDLLAAKQVVNQRSKTRKRIAAFVGAAGLAGFIAVNASKDETTTDVPYVADVTPEEGFDQLDSKIEEIEEGFRSFAEFAVPLIIENTEEGHFRDQLIVPFQLMEINESNPNKNRQTLVQSFARDPRETINIRQENPNYFSLDFNQNSSAEIFTGNFIAAYSAPYRTMYVGENFDPQNLLDMLILYHELRHVAQDNRIRQNLDTEEQFESYLEFHSVDPGEAPTMIINEEATAYAYEIELMNILLDGQVRELAESDRYASRMDIEVILERLNARPDQNGTVEMLLNLAGDYYPVGLSTDWFDEEYLRRLASLLRDNGYEVVVPVSGGGLRRFE